MPRARSFFPRATSEGFLLCTSSTGAECLSRGGAGGLPAGCRRIEIMIVLRKIKVFGLGEGPAGPWPGPRAGPWLGPMAQGSSPIKGAILGEKLPPEARWFY